MLKPQLALTPTDGLHVYVLNANPCFNLSRLEFRHLQMPVDQNELNSPVDSPPRRSVEGDVLSMWDCLALPQPESGRTRCGPV
jgi:hypothetical protein